MQARQAAARLTATALRRQAARPGRAPQLAAQRCVQLCRFEQSVHVGQTCTCAHNALGRLTKHPSTLQQRGRWPGWAGPLSRLHCAERLLQSTSRVAQREEVSTSGRLILSVAHPTLRSPAAADLSTGERRPAGSRQRRGLAQRAVLRAVSQGAFINSQLTSACTAAISLPAAADLRAGERGPAGGRQRRGLALRAVPQGAGCQHVGGPQADQRGGARAHHQGVHRVILLGSTVRVVKAILGSQQSELHLVACHFAVRLVASLRAQLADTASQHSAQCRTGVRSFALLLSSEKHQRAMVQGSRLSLPSCCRRAALWQRAG